MNAAYGVKQAESSQTCRDGGDHQMEGAGGDDQGQNNDFASFAGVVGRYAGIVYWLALYVTGDNKDAEDVLQQTFLKADSDSAKSQQNESSVAWLLGIAVSESFAKLRVRDPDKLLRLSLEAEADAAFVPQEVVDWGDNAGNRYTREELRKIVHEGIRSLTPFSRVVFLLRDVAKLRTEEIADLLHLPVPSIKSRLFGSRLQLREHFNKYFKPTFKEAAQTG